MKLEDLRRQRTCDMKQLKKLQNKTTEPLAITRNYSIYLQTYKDGLPIFRIQRNDGRRDEVLFGNVKQLRDLTNFLLFLLSEKVEFGSEQIVDPLNIAQKVKDIIIEQLGVNPKEVTLQATLRGDLSADSLDTVELTMALEQEFNIEIPDKDAKGLKTVGQVISYIAGHKCLLI